MIVEPFANDKLEDNLNPIGRVFYSASTMLCTPASLSQEVGLGPGRASRRGALDRGSESAGFSKRAARCGNAVQHRPRSARVRSREELHSLSRSYSSCARRRRKHFLQHAVGGGIQLVLKFAGLPARLIHQRGIEQQPHAVHERPRHVSFCRACAAERTLAAGALSCS